MPTKKVIKAEDSVKEEAKPKKKKAAAKKTTKKAAVKKEVAKKTVKDYVDLINWKKGEAHALNWLYIDANAGELLQEQEPDVDNLETVCAAIKECLLIGDYFLELPEKALKNPAGYVSKDLTVRYYCDNLDPSREKYHF